MPSRYPFSVRVALVFPLTLVPAFSITSISSAGCVAPVAFNSCTSQVDAYTLTCVNGADGDQLVLYGCYTMYYELQTKCYLVSCWNKVYSCEYQNLAIDFIETSLTHVDIPFFPPPNNAPGGCSCNIGQLYQTQIKYLQAGIDLCKGLGIGSSNTLCHCCASSGALSSFYSLCPDTNETAIELPSALENAQFIEGKCTGSFDASACVTQFSFPAVPSGTFLPPGNLPSWTGMNPLTTTGGLLTALPSGSLITWTADSTFTVTARPYNPATAASISSAVASNGTGTTTGTAAQATTSKNGGSAGPPKPKEMLYAGILVGLLATFCTYSTLWLT